MKIISNNARTRRQIQKTIRLLRRLVTRDSPVNLTPRERKEFDEAKVEIKKMLVGTERLYKLVSGDDRRTKRRNN
jgi:hypothetical protein